jgi:hypothetical protein
MKKLGLKEVRYAHVFSSEYRSRRCPNAIILVRRLFPLLLRVIPGYSRNNLVFVHSLMGEINLLIVVEVFCFMYSHLLMGVLLLRKVLDTLVK